MEEKLVFKVLEYGSQEQIDSIELRRKILREPLGLRFSKSELQQEADQFHLAALIDSHLIGILLMQPKIRRGENLVKMRQVAIAKTYQGKGVGKKLVEFAESWTRDHQFQGIELNARESVLNFYLLMNYKIVGEKFEEVGIPHRSMIKYL